MSALAAAAVTAWARERLEAPSLVEAPDALPASEGADLVILQASRFGPLMSTFMRIADGMAMAGRAVLSDIVWSTAPTPELLAAFGPPHSPEAVRPVEGYEMQMEHAGLRIVERFDVPRDAWRPDLDAAAAAAVDADTRGAAALAAWLVERVE